MFVAMSPAVLELARSLERLRQLMFYSVRFTESVVRERAKDEMDN